jgi:hypothetical protein
LQQNKLISRTPVSRIYFLLAMAHLLIATLIGVFIRWHFLYPIPYFNYSHWIHAHSHIAFLGWVFLGLMALINFYYEKSEDFPRRKFKILAGWVVAANLGMLISFPIQGYGPVSIFFSAVHMILAIYVFFLYNPFLKEEGSLGFQLVRWGLIFMILSGIGPFMLGPIVALGYKQTQWYDFAIYFYLHFQYNGFFTLTILGLIIHHLEKDHRHLFLENIRNPIIYGLAMAILLTYFLSVLGTEPPLIFYLLGGLGAVIQIVIVILILITLLRYYSSFFHHSNFYINLLLVIGLTCLETKLYLQFFSGIPAIANYVFHDRNIIIVYLHMVLLGFITSFLIAWWFKLNPSRMKVYFYWSILNFLLGFMGSETILCLIILKVFGGFVLPFQVLLFFSIFMLLGFGGIFTGFLLKKRINM